VRGLFFARVTARKGDILSALTVTYSPVINPLAGVLLYANQDKKYNGAGL
jgi:hypothetical protein